MTEPIGSIQAVLQQHRRVAIDSNLLIYLMESDPRRADAVATLVDAVAEGEVVGILASVGLAEALVGPARLDDGAGFEQAAATIRDLGFDVVPLDAASAEDAAWIRGRSGLSMPDAVHLACARGADATVFVTNDRRILSRPGLDVVHLDDLLNGEPVP